MAESFTSSMGLLKNLILESDRMCAIHNEPMHEYRGHVACQKCQREKVQAEDEALRAEAMKRYEKRITFDKLYKDSIVGDYTLREANFDNYAADDAETERNKLAARRIAGRYLKGEVFNTLLTGTAGAGKSHLAMGILKAVNEHADPWKSCLFISLDEFLLDIRSTYNDKLTNEDERTLVERVATVDLLVIDDLGAETGFIGTDKVATNFTQRILYALMNRRQDKSTIITTNLNSKQVAAMYDSKVISRLYRNLGDNILTFSTDKDRRIKF